MPTYDYICDACAHGFEAFESIKADAQTICPSCNAPSLRRKIGPGAALLFKGSGFYITDYRSDSYKERAKADSSSSSSPSSSNSSSSSSSSSSNGNSSSSSSSSSGASSAPAGSAK